MTIYVDLYYTMRSPYCYLATPTLAQLVKQYDLFFNLKPVYPLAVSDPTFFEKVNPMWPPYLSIDTRRIAERLNIPFRWPRPDPVVQDMTTRKISNHQPYITRLTHFAQIAADKGQGLEYICSVSALLYDPEISGWNEGDYLRNTMSDVKLDFDEFQQIAEQQASQLETKVQNNRKEQLDSGHWGAPLFVYQGEVFFGQDRIDDLIWYLKKAGLDVRPSTTN
tara:strand:- start:2677 stop:3342 length:666 start_codon:yes stop_codon:yes gene_type:complete